MISWGMSIRFFAIGVLVGAILILFIPIWMRAQVNPYLSLLPNDVPHTDAAVVLGASVVRGAPSPILAARADAAIELYRLDKVDRIVVSGDALEASHDEVTPVYDYLIRAGIPAKDILQDPQGIDTYQSMYGLIAQFNLSSAIITTQDFHLPRSVFAARGMGIDAYGYAADNRGSSWYNYVREIPASVKVVWDVYTHRLLK